MWLKILVKPWDYIVRSYFGYYHICFTAPKNDLTVKKLHPNSVLMIGYQIDWWLWVVWSFVQTHETHEFVLFALTLPINKHHVNVDFIWIAKCLHKMIWSSKHKLLGENMHNNRMIVQHNKHGNNQVFMLKIPILCTCKNNQATSTYVKWV